MTQRRSAAGSRFPEGVTRLACHHSGYDAPYWGYCPFASWLGRLPGWLGTHGAWVCRAAYREGQGYGLWRDPALEPGRQPMCPVALTGVTLRRSRSSRPAGCSAASRPRRHCRTSFSGLPSCAGARAALMIEIPAPDRLRVLAAYPQQAAADPVLLTQISALRPGASRRCSGRRLALRRADRARRSCPGDQRPAHLSRACRGPAVVPAGPDRGCPDLGAGGGLRHAGGSGDRGRRPAAGRQRDRAGGTARARRGTVSPAGSVRARRYSAD